jgi:UDP-glucose:(galactosyl)LPS alpha-1,2-glucosyltransferase
MIPKETIHLAIAFDEKFVVPFYTLATSIFQNNRYNRFHFHLLATGLSSEEQQKMQQYIETKGSGVTFYALSSKNLEHLFITDAVQNSMATYYKLFFPQLVPGNVDKLLYLDTDIVVNGDLQELYATDLGSFPVAVVPERFNNVLRPELGIDKTGIYFNAGVQLMNVSQWNKQQITEKALAFVREHPEAIFWYDQDALNAVIRENYVTLEMKYNVNTMDVPRTLSKTEYKAFVKDKVIIHYTTESKPWNPLTRHRLRFLYFNYLRHSPRNEKKYLVFQPTPGSIFRFLKSSLKETFFNIIVLSKLRKTQFFVGALFVMLMQ